MKIITRFAPSPSGLLHIGNIKSALYSWLLAKQNNGVFLLRIENTDVKKSRYKNIENIKRDIKWIGLNWYGKVFLQINRLLFYKNIIKQLLKYKIAYKCYCSKNRLNKFKKNRFKYDMFCRNKIINFNKKYIIRFKNSYNGNVLFNDIIYGNFFKKNIDLEDFVICRNNGLPTYNFCCAIDDWDMKISHIIRGEEHINNTILQINLLKSIGVKIPIYAHFPIILDIKKKKLSKRKNSISIFKFKKNGFLPIALLNYLIKLGWSYKNIEIFNINDMINLFKLNSVKKSPSIFDIHKLLWINKYYINSFSFKYIKYYIKYYIIKFKINLKNGPLLKEIFLFLKNRYNTIKDLVIYLRFLYNNKIKLNIKKVLIYKNIFNLSNLKFIYKIYYRINSWTLNNIIYLNNKLIKKFKTSKNIFQMFLRFIFTGKEKTPELNNIIYLIRKNNILKRIKNSYNYF